MWERRKAGSCGPRATNCEPQTTSYKPPSSFPDSPGEADPGGRDRGPCNGRRRRQGYPQRANHEPQTRDAFQIRRPSERKGASKRTRPPWPRYPVLDPSFRRGDEGSDSRRGARRERWVRPYS